MVLQKATIKKVWVSFDTEEFIPADSALLPVGLEDVLDYEEIALDTVMHGSFNKKFGLWISHMFYNFALQFEEDGEIDAHTTIYHDGKVVCNYFKVRDVLRKIFMDSFKPEDFIGKTIGQFEKLVPEGITIYRKRTTDSSNDHPVTGRFYANTIWVLLDSEHTVIDAGLGS